jgi:hypothetical protein
MCMVHELPYNQISEQLPFSQHPNSSNCNVPYWQMTSEKENCSGFMKKWGGGLKITFFRGVAFCDLVDLYRRF